MGIAGICEDDKLYSSLVHFCTKTKIFVNAFSYINKYFFNVQLYLNSATFVNQKSIPLNSELFMHIFCYIFKYLYTYLYIRKPNIQLHTSNMTFENQKQNTTHDSESFVHNNQNCVCTILYRVSEKLSPLLPEYESEDYELLIKTMSF